MNSVSNNIFMSGQLQFLTFRLGSSEQQAFNISSDCFALISILDSPESKVPPSTMQSRLGKGKVELFLP